MTLIDKFARKYLKMKKKPFNYNSDIELPAMIKMLGNVRGKTILDMGCGIGDHASKITGFKQYIGFDISKRLIEIANQKKIPKTDFYIGDMGKKLKHKNFFLISELVSAIFW